MVAKELEYEPDGLSKIRLGFFDRFPLTVRGGDLWAVRPVNAPKPPLFGWDDGSRTFVFHATSIDQYMGGIGAAAKHPGTIGQRHGRPVVPRAGE